MDILTEDAVIDAVAQLLADHGWTIESRANAHQHGHDLVAERDGDRLFIEAKGAGSSKPHTSRYGQEFRKRQVFDHVAKAILKALRINSNGQGRAGIALPDNQNHRGEVSRVERALQTLEIAVFWVTPDGRVEVENGARILTDG